MPSSTVNIYLTLTRASSQNELEARYLSQLPGSEQQRYKKLHPKRQIEWLHARTLLHNALNEHYGLDAGLQYLQRHEKGGLYFPDKDLSVSISHSHGTVGVALIDQPLELGLDMEIIRPRKLSHHTDNIFTSAENTWLAHQSPDQHLAAFYQLWTLKEACIKACRESIWLGLQALEFNFDATPLLSSKNPILQGHWQLAWGQPRADLQLALAVKNTKAINNLQLWWADNADTTPELAPHHLNVQQTDCQEPVGFRGS